MTRGPNAPASRPARILFLMLLALACGGSRIERAAAQGDTVPATVPPAAPTDTASISTSTAADSIPLPHFEPIPDRWRDIKPPPFELYVEGHWYDPYNQNVLKGDYPIIGQNTFLSLTASSDNVFEFSTAPTPSGVSAERPRSEPFFGDDNRSLLNGNLRLTLELYHGQTAFRPRDWEIRVTPVLSLNRLALQENNNVNINVRKGTDRNDSHLGFQELFFEKHLIDVSDRYDFVSLRVGIQKFSSDFRGFVFTDFNRGARLFGTAGSNRWQWNLAYFDLLEKDTNSELNTVFDDRHQHVFVANVYRQDFLALGYTAQLSFHYNRDEASEHVDENGVPVRPAIFGDAKPHEIRAYYLGWTGDGHIGRLNVSHAFYQVFGTDERHPSTSREIDIDARLAALELSVDKDWMRFRASALYASGDSDPRDDTGGGFDGIVDQPSFAGGPFSFWNQQVIRLQGVNLVNKLSPLPNLRPNKFEGQANFVNPGIFIANVGYDAEVTPKVKAVANVNYLSFLDTAILTDFLNQPEIDNPIGIDSSLGVIYRPFLNNNAVVTVAGSMLNPLAGFDDIYESPGTLFSLLASVALTY